MWTSIFGNQSTPNAVQLVATPTATTEAEALSHSKTQLLWEAVTAQPHPGGSSVGKKISATTNVQSRFFVLNVQAERSICVEYGIKWARYTNK